jgi:2-keto-4-pentenoate hydratase/2-oxohepta-3-ene-1,7-dioic acid hydratase in catechol pathway
MRITRVAHKDGWCYAELHGPVDESGDCRVVAFDGPPFDGGTPTRRQWPLDGVRLLAPVVPSKIIGVGRNYRSAGETAGNQPGEPLVFFKPPSSVVGLNEAIVLPNAGRIDFEGELAVVIGTGCRSVSRARAHEVIFGYTIANDVTSRDHQRSDSQWTRAKGFDTFCPLGPWIDTELDTSDLLIQTAVDGVVRQKGRTRSMIYEIPALIEWLSAFMTLLPGDVVLTGTPEGSAALRSGQSVAVEVERLGTLTNTVVGAGSVS